MRRMRRMHIQQSRTKVMLGEQEIYKYVHTAFRLIQYHLCARADDIVLLDTDEIRRNKFGSIDIKLVCIKEHVPQRRLILANIVCKHESKLVPLVGTWHLRILIC